MYPTSSPLPGRFVTFRQAHHAVLVLQPSRDWSVTDDMQQKKGNPLPCPAPQPLHRTSRAPPAPPREPSAAAVSWLMGPGGGTECHVGWN
jgi:hypothetical protein